MCHVEHINRISKVINVTFSKLRNLKFDEVQKEYNQKNDFENKHLWTIRFSILAFKIQIYVWLKKDKIEYVSKVRKHHLVSNLWLVEIPEQLD